MDFDTLFSGCFAKPLAQPGIARDAARYQDCAIALGFGRGQSPLDEIGDHGFLKPRDQVER